MRIPIREEEFEHIELNGTAALFTNNRIAYTTVPKGFYPYEVRGSDNDPGEPATLEHRVGVNFAGTVITAKEMKFPKSKDCLPIKNKLNFLGECMSLYDFANRHSIALSEDNRKYILRPATEGNELFYSQGEAEDIRSGCVGHLRIDYGRTDTEFWHTWHPHNEDRFNTEEFKAELDEMVNELREQGPLKSRAMMSYFCNDQGAPPLESSDYPQYGFTTESEHYKYYLRCNPRQGDYNGYLYIYDKREQQLEMSEPKQEMSMGGM